MKIAQLIAAMAIWLRPIGLFGQCMPEPPIKITMLDIPRVVECLKTGTADPCWAVLLLVEPSQGEDLQYITINYRFKGNIPCLEWVLLGKRNVADKEKVIALAKSLGVPFKELKQNGVKFIRVSGSNAIPFGRDILSRIYNLSSDSEFILSPMGFAWVPGAP